ncbi:MAG: PKD domain-containing protein, partial [Bacteroidota bacterium]
GAARGLITFPFNRIPTAPSGPYTYAWSPDVSLNDPNTVDPFATPDTTTIYTLIVGSANGCSSQMTTVNPLSTVTVEVRPKPQVEAGPDIDLCLGDTASLSGFATSAGPQYDYFWTPATGLTDSSDQQTAVSPRATTTYFFISRSNGCRSVADSVTVKVHTLPTVLPSSVYDICALDSIELRAIAGGDLLTDEFSYQWSPALGLDNPTPATPMASPDTSTVYTIEATSLFGCGSEQVEVPVQVRPTPTIALGNDTTICEGDTLSLVSTFRVTGGNPTQPTFFTWTPIQNLSSPLIREPLAYPDENTLYTVETRIGGCATVDSIFIDVTPAVVLTVEADTTRSCSADSVQLFAIGPDPTNATYQWFPVDGLSDPSFANPMASPDTSTTYTVTVTQVGCDAQQGIDIEVIPSPVVDYFHTVSVGCPDVTVNFVENTENALFYIWDLGDGSPVTNVPNPVRTYSTPGVYTVSLTAVGEAGCETSISRPIVEVFAPGEASFVTDPDEETPLILPGADVNFSNTSTGAVEYYWEFGDGGTSKAENPTHTYREAGNYTVKLITRDAGGCIDEYVYGPITVIEPDLDIPNVFTPNGDGLNDAFRVTYNGKSTFRMDILDRWGRTLAEGITNPVSGWDGRTGDGEEVSAGVYYYVIYIGDRLYKGDLTLLR